MKRILAIAIAAMFLTLLTPIICSASAEQNFQIVTTIFPIYDWVRNIIGDSDLFNVTFLLDSGIDLHSYQPTAADMLKIATCDLFIYVGGESDEWVEDALEEAANPDMRVLCLLDALGDAVKMEETVEGMETDEEEEEEEADEHVWLSLRNAEVLVSAAAEQIAQLDPDRKDTYLEHAISYSDKLKELDLAYSQAVQSASFKTILFGDRFPFRYLVDDYGLSYFAAFSGCSAETEASFSTIIFLAKKLDELDLPAILTIEGTDHKIAETIIDATVSKNQKLLVLDSMQGITGTDAANGASYLSIMQSNLEVLRQALN